VSVVREREGSRRWPWVLMALLPIIVIVGSGIWLFILLSHA
jgi:ATP/ADP translocase